MTVKHIVLKCAAGSRDDRGVQTASRTERSYHSQCHVHVQQHEVAVERSDALFSSLGLKNENFKTHFLRAACVKKNDGQ